MRYYIAIFLGAVVLAAGCSSDVRRAPAPVTIPVVVSGRAGVVYEITMQQLTAPTRKIAGRVAQPVSVLNDGLPEVQKVTRNPILAMAEQDGWFFYATSTATSQETHVPVSFISGYAIKRGDRQIIEWSVW